MFDKAQNFYCEDSIQIEHIDTVEQDQPLSAVVLKPRGWVQDPPLLALHGISRDTNAMVAAFMPEVFATRRVVVIPRFSRKRWPVFQRITRRHRPDRALLALISDLRLRGQIGSGAVDLFGFSGGAQLAHRFTMLHPEAIGDLHLGAAGWYTLPDPDLPYPVGIGPSDRGDDRWGRHMASGLKRYLDRRIQVYVGTNDNDPNDPALRQSPLLQAAQGATRLDRARRYTDQISAMQIDADLPITCGLTELVGCPHDFEECVRIAALASRVARARNT